MGSYYVVSKNGQHQTFIGAGGLDQALRFAAGEGSIWKMTKEDVIRKGLSNPKTEHQLREVRIEANILIWSEGAFRTTTGNRPI